MEKAGRVVVTVLHCKAVVLQCSRAERMWPLYDVGAIPLSVCVCAHVHVHVYIVNTCLRIALVQSSECLLRSASYFSHPEFGSTRPEFRPLTHEPLLGKGDQTSSTAKT